MLSGKFWITPDGVVDVSASEHALYAKNAMLGLLGQPGELRLGKDLFLPLGPDEVELHRGCGAREGAIAHLAGGLDPRLYAIREWNWVRVRRSLFQFWRPDSATLRMIRNADDYWKAQACLDPGEWVELSWLSPPRGVRTVTLWKLRYAKLKNILNILLKNKC